MFKKLGDMKPIHQVFGGILLLLFISLPSHLSAQVIIKEKMELSNKAITPVATASAPTDQYYCCYLHIGGSYNLEIRYVWNRDFYKDYELWEEGLGKIGSVSNLSEGQIINLGQFYQWEHFYFYLYNPKEDKSKDASGIVGFDYYPTEKDSSLAVIPPSIALDHFGNPFTPRAEVKVMEDGYMRLEVRDGSIGSKDLYMDMPEERLLQENIKKVDRGYYIDVGTVRKGETYRFYIKSDFPIVAGDKLYPKYTYWNNYDRIAELRFEDWTDLHHNDLRIYVQVTEHPKAPRSISIKPSPRKVLPDYDKKVHFNLKRVNKDYSSQDFLEGQTFDVQMDEAKSQYATLHNPKTGQKGTRLQGVTEGFHMDIESYEVIGEFNGSVKLNVSTKVLHPITEEKVEISGTKWLNIVNKKMFLSFSPNPVSKGDTAKVKPYLIYANGIKKHLPSNYPLVYASISDATESLGTLGDIASGKTGDFLCCMSSGVEFIARSDIPQDTAVARITVSAYVDKGMPSQEITVAATEVNTSEYNKTITQLDPGNNKKLKKQFMKVSSNPISSASETMQEGGLGAVDILGHNSDQDYLNGSGSLLITNTKLEPCKEITPNINIEGKPQPDNFFGCKKETRIGLTNVISKEVMKTIKACFYLPDNKWGTRLSSVYLPIGYGVCPQNADYMGLFEIRNVQQGNITEDNYCEIKEKIKKLVIYKSRGMESAERVDEIMLWSYDAAIHHEKTHVKQLKNFLTIKMYEFANQLKQLSLPQDGASSSKEARRKLLPKALKLWKTTKIAINKEYEKTQRKI